MIPLLLWLAGLLVSAAVAFVVIRLAVLSAMKAHTVWHDEGGYARDRRRREERAAAEANDSVFD